MTITTTTWDPIPADITIFYQKALEMQAEGKTDDSTKVVTYAGVPGVPGSVGPAPLVVVRQWATMQDAQEWIDFITPYNPQSAIINS
jgi:hypothetical protein